MISSGRRLEQKLRGALSLGLQWIIQSGSIYTKERFPLASDETLKRVESELTAYQLAELNHRLLVEAFQQDFEEMLPRSLEQIADAMAEDVDNFSINEYPPSSAVLYWFVDGVDRAELKLDPRRWSGLCAWAAKEFNHRRSLVMAEHDAMMDPVAMAMSACLCARLRAIGEKPVTGATKEHLSALPSMIELERSIEELISKQASSGIWPKYFPLFHYQDAGSNFCFTFELLEAVLYEFGDKPGRLLNSDGFVKGLENAVIWCESNIQECREQGVL